MTADVGGRPTALTEEVALEICSRLAEGETLRQICRDDHLPARSSVLLWVVENRNGFSDRYAQARTLCLEAWADDVIDIGDDATNDWMAKRMAGADEDDPNRVAWTINGEHVQRSRLRIDSRKWLLSKLKPEKYGDKIQHGGDAGNPIQHQVGVSWMTEAQAKARGWA